MKLATFSSMFSVLQSDFTAGLKTKTHWFGCNFEAWLHFQRTFRSQRVFWIISQERFSPPVRLLTWTLHPPTAAHQSKGGPHVELKQVDWQNNFLNWLQRRTERCFASFFPFPESRSSKPFQCSATFQKVAGSIFCLGQHVLSKPLELAHTQKNNLWCHLFEQLEPHQGLSVWLVGLIASELKLVSRKIEHFSKAPLSWINCNCVPRIRPFNRSCCTLLCRISSVSAGLDQVSRQRHTSVKNRRVTFWWGRTNTQD